MNKSNGLQKQEKKLRALDDNQARGDDGSGDANKKRGKNEGDCEAISHSPQGERELSVGK